MRSFRVQERTGMEQVTPDDTESQPQDRAPVSRRHHQGHQEVTPHRQPLKGAFPVLFGEVI